MTRRLSLCALVVGLGACGGGSGAGGPDDATNQAPALVCDGTLPDGLNADVAARTLTVPCAESALSVTAFEDGIMRLRYGDASGSLVPLALPPPAADFRIGTSKDGQALVCSGPLTLAVVPKTCALTVVDATTGETMLADGPGGGFFREGAAVGVTRTTPASERFYGLGLHSAAATARGLDLRGSEIELYNTDAFDSAAGGFPPNAKSLYESIPFYLGLHRKAAYGVFTDNTHRLTFDLAAKEPTRVRIRAAGGAIEQYVLGGPSLRDVVRRYTALTGRIAPPPLWSLGFQQSRWEAPCEGAPPERPFCSAPQVVSVAQRLRAERIPADGIFLDIQHMDGFRSFTFDPQRFPDPSALTAELAALGFAASVIVDPGIKIDSAWSVFQTGRSGGHFLQAPQGGIFEGQVWPGAVGFPDFGRAATRTWWSDLVAETRARGVTGMWIDMNEPASFTPGAVPDDVRTSTGTMAELHNAYAYFEAAATFEGLKRARPNERPFVLSRAAFAGQQRYSAVWTGDAPSTWTALAGTLPQLLHLGLSGMAFSGSDVGGYSGRSEATSELFTRWMALGAVSPFFRAHAEKDARRQEPWSFGDEVEDAVRGLVQERYALLPYLVSVFDEAARTGAPILRPLVFEFQEDEASRAVVDEAMLGSSILVAPVLGREPTRSVYLPPGRWFDLRSGASREGGRTIALPPVLPKDALPLYARAGAIVPRAGVGARAEDARTGPLYLDVFPSARERSTFELVEDDGLAGGASSRVRLATEATATGLRLEASAREGTYVTRHARTLVRIRRIDHEPSAVTLDGASLARAAAGVSPSPGTFAYDAEDRAIVIPLEPGPFAIDVRYDPTLLEDGDVDVPLRIALPAGTPTASPIHIASSRDGWAHRPITRAGDVATATLRIPRGDYVFFKISRGDWASVEKTALCAEIENRAALGVANRPLDLVVRTWADRCN